MKPLRNLFGTSKERKARRIVKATQRKVEETYGPLSRLGLGIVSTAWAVQQTIGPTFGYSADGTPSEPQILTFCEFIYFFYHLALRTAVLDGFSDEQLKITQGYLDPLLTSTAVDSFFQHWPEDVKKKMRGEILDKLNEAQSEYGQCTALSSDTDPLSQGTLLGSLACNVADLWDVSDEQPMLAVVSVASAAFSGMGVRSLLQEVAVSIDSINADEIEAFWKWKEQ